MNNSKNKNNDSDWFSWALILSCIMLTFVFPFLVVPSEGQADAALVESSYVWDYEDILKVESEELVKKFVVQPKIYEGYDINNFYKDGMWFYVDFTDNKANKRYIGKLKFSSKKQSNATYNMTNDNIKNNAEVYSYIEDANKILDYTICYVDDYSAKAIESLESVDLSRDHNLSDYVDKKYIPKEASTEASEVETK